jgi:exodeoxyribonuclease VII large subunit
MESSRIVYSVSELTNQIKLLLEENFPNVWVEGEISNYKKHYSGHYYFTLKDQSSQVACVMWKSRTNSISFELEDGMRVHIFGNIRLYEKSGRYQLDSILIQQAGIGKLQLNFEKLKKQLYDEGLFDEKHKKPIPKIPKTIGIITSPTGAAINDILSVIKRRYPVCELLIKGVKVQGENASDDIVKAIMQLNTIEDDIDLIILGRGGGSLEDLWAFNEEIVARAIFDSKIPIISAVGHDIDFTISDFVSDLRAPTPSAAAELSVPDINELKPKIIELNLSLTSNFNRFILNSKNNITNFLKSYAFRKPEDLLRQYSQRLDDIIPKLNSVYINHLNRIQNYIDNLVTRLTSLHPEHVIRRGYALVYKKRKLVKSIEDVDINDIVDIQIKDGKIKSLVREKNHGEKSKF